MKRWFIVLLTGLVVAEILLCAGAYWAMRQPPDRFGGIVARLPMPMMMTVPFETLWTRARAGTVHVGDQAPDFRLPLLDHSGTVQLSQFRGKQHVVLVFGSYT